jgi:hypothetical protein
VVLIPYLGYKLLPERGAAPSRFESWLRVARKRLVARLPAALRGENRRTDEGGHHDPYATPFYHRFRALVDWCVGHRRSVIAATVLLFVLSIVGFGFVQQQFFPDSTRPELMVDLKLTEGASLNATEAQVKKLEAWLAKRPELENYVSYVGSGAPRFYLPLDQQLPQASFAEFVLLTKGTREREALRADLIALFEHDFTELRARVLRLENGPPVGYPVQFRISGADIPTVRELARKAAEVVRQNPNVRNVNLDWEEPSKVVRLSIDQERARVLGVSSQDLANFLQSSLSGVPVTYYRERDQLIEVSLRGPGDERARLSLLESLAVPTPSGQSVPLKQIATVSYGFEEGIIWRRNACRRSPCAATSTAAHAGYRYRADRSATRCPAGQLPAGYLLQVGGAVEKAPGPDFRQRRHAAVPARRADPADDPAAQFLARAAGLSHGATGPDRRHAVPARVQRAVRIRRDARHDRTDGHDHAQLGDPGRPDRAGHRRRSRPLDGDRRCDDAALSSDRADGARGDPGDDSADAQRVLRTDGGRDHGRVVRRHGADLAVPAGAVRGLVPRAPPARARHGTGSDFVATALVAH